MNFEPTKISKGKCYSFIGIALCIYFINNSFFSTYIDSEVLNFIINPLLWSGLALIIWMIPHVRMNGKLRHKGFIHLWAFNFGFIFIGISFFAGIFNGLGKSPYDHSFIGILLNLVLISTTLIGREFLRNYLVNSFTKNGSQIVFVLISLFMTFLSFPFNRYIEFKGAEDLVQFIAKFLAPEFAQNLFATYLAFLGGPVPSMIYIGTIKAFHWFSPILPDLKWLVAALIGTLVPVFSLMFMNHIYMKEAKLLNKHKDKENPFGLMVSGIFSILIIWFAVGVFPYYPSAIATGSMIPMIDPGDVIIVKKVEAKSVKVGDVIQFRRDSILISHRIIEMKKDKDGQTVYRTKGDNNSVADSELVKPEDIKGEVIYVIPKIGWASLIFRKDDVPREQVEF